MGFFKNLVEKWNKRVKLPDEDEAEEEKYLVGVEDVNLADDYERRKYIESLLEQVSDATKQVDACNSEYKTINHYLQDIEQLEYLTPDDRRLVTEHAKAIIHLSVEGQRYEEKKNRMSDEDFERMEKLENDADDGAKRIKEAEDYQQLIRNDLKRLEGEKQACLFRRSEAAVNMNNLRGMALITLIAVAACILILSVLQFGLGLEARVGFYLTAGAGAIALTAIYMTYLDAQKENTRAGRSLNKVILLQNRVKIRYVNNTNLLEYLYMKFGISSAAELEKLRKQYAEEKEERERIRENRKEMTYSQSELIKILKSYRFYDPMIWLHQAQALVDPKEMVEVRHALILRRQKLRQRLDFNSQNASAAQEQIRSIVAEYPEYAKEILKMISDFETGMNPGVH